MPACVYGRVLKHRGDVGHLRHSYTFIWTAAFILEGAVMENTGSLALAAWLGSDLWQLKLQVLTSRARALSHLLHRSRVVPTPSCSNQRDLCSEQNITVQPDISLQNHFLFNVETREQRRGDGRLRRFICLTEQRREKGEQCLSVPHLHGCVCVWGGYLVEQRQAAGHPVLQLDDGDEVAILSLILACVAQGQRVILQKHNKDSSVFRFFTNKRQN